ncbi:hypothetical protein SFUMM280S_06357 [Streptomyces fumanus]
MTPVARMAHAGAAARSDSYTRCPGGPPGSITPVARMAHAGAAARSDSYTRWPAAHRVP